MGHHSEEGVGGHDRHDRQVPGRQKGMAYQFEGNRDLLRRILNYADRHWWVVDSYPCCFKSHQEI